jgi:[acyl-carrier-protein] S-malonyltransferase
MEPAREELANAINEMSFSAPSCAVYQNYTAEPETDPAMIKSNLIAQLTAPVLWAQTIRNMVAAGATDFIEAGPGKVLQGLIKKIEREARVESFMA